jgi:hypothetical protein
VLNIQASTFTGGSRLCIGGKVDGQTAGDMFFSQTSSVSLFYACRSFKNTIKEIESKK